MAIAYLLDGIHIESIMVSFRSYERQNFLAKMQMKLNKMVDVFPLPIILSFFFKFICAISSTKKKKAEHWEGVFQQQRENSGEMEKKF